MARFHVGQRIRFIDTSFYDTGGEFHTCPLQGYLCDVVKVTDGTASITVHAKKAGVPYAATVKLPWNGGNLTSQFQSVRGRPFVPGDDTRRREGTNPSDVPQGCTSAKSATTGTITADVLALAELLTKLGHSAPATLDEAAVTAIMERVAGEKGWGTARVEITTNGVTHKVDGFAHQALAQVTAHATQRSNILVVGPAGSGKTTLGEQLAQAIFGSAERFASVSCSRTMPESVWLGRLTPNVMTGKQEYFESPMVNLVRNGGVFLADELDNGDSSALLSLNALLANGHVTLPTGERLRKHKDFIFLGSANTYGHGQSREYVGREQWDAAFGDRFVGATVEFDYDRKLEANLCPDTAILNAVHAIRDKVTSLKLRRIVSTRAILAAHRLVHGQGKTLKEALAAITVGWSVADKQAVGVA